MAKKPLDEIEIIRELSLIINEESLHEIEIEKEGTRIRVQNQSGQINNIAQAQLQPTIIANNPHSNQDVESVPEINKSETSSKKFVKSPMVGTCYLSPEPGSKPFIQVGSRVNKGDPIIIIEAMKTFNTIPSTESGTVKNILVNDGQPIEFGENIIEIE
ncbi:MAG: acetyl-CoA carboxylase, biotin carboxyl carrier protein [Rhodobiaceae bacterium]|nr:acetyl-CoA carboxylase, biotin carboxyl carrier protein [Rhodobiaceae bacterium]RPF97943.1 MAG: acetyl-CoA carboxylase biotin carboxyl carrier protein [Rhizobiales bacterium TMED227]